MVNDIRPLPDDLPEYLRPALRIFLSVDIVNSTAFKQAAAAAAAKPGDKKPLVDQDEDPFSDNAEPWFSPIAGFYSAIEQKLAEEWSKRLPEVTALDKRPGDAPCLWKARGDEVIYVKQLDDPFQALLATRAWMGAVNSHRVQLKESFPSLDLKAAAWIAGFPVNNAEVVLRRVAEASNPLDDLAQGESLLLNFLRLEKLHQAGCLDNGEMFRDFIGPSMDTGFRVASQATPRKFAVTIDLAYMLAHAAENIPAHIPHPQLKKPSFQYDGRVVLKGVSSGAPYPFFWIDMKEDEELLEEEDDLMGRKRLLCAQVLSFCSKFFGERKDRRGPFITPYIYGEKRTSPFGHFPDAHFERLEALAYGARELEKRKLEKESQLKAEAQNDKQEIPPKTQDHQEVFKNELAKYLLQTLQAHRKK